MNFIFVSLFFKKKSPLRQEGITWFTKKIILHSVKSATSQKRKNEVDVNFYYAIANILFSHEENNSVLLKFVNRK